MTFTRGSVERLGSSALWVVLGSEEDATAEEIEVGAAVHGVRGASEQKMHFGFGW